MSAADKPLVILDPHPRPIERNFTPHMLETLNANFRVISHDNEPMPAALLDEHLPEAVALIGQSDLPQERLKRAKKLRAIFNCEGNFYQNIDYDYCFQNNIRVLGCGEGYAQAVAEMGLGMAIDLARSISTYDRLFRQGEEVYLADACHDSVLLSGAKVGLIGFGALGRALRPLLAPFRCPVKVYDPWLPDSFIREHDATPASLDEVLSQSQFIFVLASVTGDNQGFLAASQFDKIQPGSFLLLLSRAAVVDFDEMLKRAEAGQFKVGTDVFPEEPMPKDHPVRKMRNVLLSPHRAGGIPAAFFKIGQMIIDDLLLVARGLPPVVMQHANYETVTRMMSKPAD